MFNLRTVIKFEVLRAIKKPTFWVALLAVPLVYGGLFFLGKISGEQAAQNAEKLAREEFSFEIMDESGILNQQIIESVGGKVSKNKSESIEKVKSEKLNAFYFIPKNLKDQSVEIFGKFEGVNQSAKYSAVISSLLKNSSLETVNPNKLAAINETFKKEETLFKNGEKYDALKEMLVPGIFLVIFYYIVVFLSNRMLTSTTEEKENRVTEMILTSISAKTLVVGKLISILILGAIQIFALLVPILIAFLGFSKNLGLPNLSNFTDGIVWDGMTILKAALILIFGLLMTVGAIIALRFGDADRTRGVELFWLYYYAFDGSVFCDANVLHGRKNYRGGFFELFPANFTDFTADSKHARNSFERRSVHRNRVAGGFRRDRNLDGCANFPIRNTFLRQKSFTKITFRFKQIISKIQTSSLERASLFFEIKDFLSKP